MISLQQRINAFVQLGNKLHTYQYDKPNSNPWFTKENISFAIKAIAQCLTLDNINIWLKPYSLPNKHPKRVGVIMAGNIPLVGFHDFLCVLITGNIFIGKASSKDKELLSEIAELLINIEPAFKPFIRFSDEILKAFDAVIATGSNNSSRYFKYYFSSYPHIIRKNRVSVAILEKETTEEELTLLGQDIFRYYGLGCRNVSKIFVPKDFSFDPFFNSIEKYCDVATHNKYANNYDYNKVLYSMQQTPFIDNGFLLVKEDAQLFSPIAVLFYSYYEDKKELLLQLEKEKDSFQCLVGREHIPFGKAQQPKLWDYADGVDTIKFLLSN